jgi:hypothetical protein
LISPAEIVDWEALLDTGLAAFIAGVGVAFTFSLAILGASRFIEASREQRTLEAGAFALLGVVGLLATAGAITAGIIVMT